MVTDGPTRGAEEVDSRAWGARPWIARTLRVAAVLLPIVAAVLVSMFVGEALWRGNGWAGTAAWMIQAAAVSTATVLVVDRFARRLLPLAGLFNLSLVFPDEAPSRFSVALRDGASRGLRARIEEHRASGEVLEAASAEELLAMVAELNEHDRITRGHTERVRAYSELIAEEMGLSPDERWRLRWGVLLHDIGKLAIAPEILNKEGRPTDEEWRVLRGHPAVGAEMIEHLAGWLGEWRHAAGQHHERWDGKGYPLGLEAEEISRAGRIVAVADTYDVITSARSYKRPMSPAVAREELVRCSGSQFDPAVVRAFLNVSLGRLRLIGGPLAWLAGVPGLGQVGSLAVTGAANLAVAASVVAATTVGGLASIPKDPSPASPEVAVPSPRSGRVRSGVPDKLSSVSAGEDGEDVAAGAPGAVDESSGGSSDGGSGEVGAADPDPDVSSGGGSGGGGGSVADPGIDSATPTTTTTVMATTPTTAPAARTTTTVSIPQVTTVPVGPTARDDAGSMATHEQGYFEVLANDSAGSSELVASSLTIVVPPANASSVQARSDGTIRYKPALLFTGTDSLVYRVCDQSAQCATATLTITVQLL